MNSLDPRAGSNRLFFAWRAMLVCLFMMHSWGCVASADPAKSDPHRLIVLTDMGADPDDQQSLIRLLLYANEIDIEGLIATTSVWQQEVIRADLVQEILATYGKVQPNLTLHSKDFPTALTLSRRLKRGQAAFGMAGVGEGRSSEGSDWILKQLEVDDPRPLWISVWGGVNTLAQALYDLRANKTPEELNRLVSKLRVYTISDQDDSGPWLRAEFPDLFYIVSPGDHYQSATWFAMMSKIDGIDNQTISNPWLDANIQQGHGALGAQYPDVAWGMEGDTPAFLNLIPNGLNEPEHPDWGGWGGRYEVSQPEFENILDGHSELEPVPESRPIWSDTSDTFTPHIARQYGRPVMKSETSFSGNQVTLWRWRDQIQNDFAARMDWSVQAVDAANHPPMVRVERSYIKVRSGEMISLDASASTDPDGDNLSYLWFHYPEAGTYPDVIAVEGSDNTRSVRVTAPDVSAPQTAHFILAVTDKGEPALTRYARVIVEITP